MTSSDSYDPLTWKPGDPPTNEAARPVAARPVARRDRSAPAWLPLALSAAVLVGGAALASASRVEAPVAAPQSSG